MAISIPFENNVQVTCGWPNCSDPAEKQVTFLDELFDSTRHTRNGSSPPVSRNLCSDHLDGVRNASLVRVEHECGEIWTNAS